jgi:competence protein ComEC
MLIQTGQQNILIDYGPGSQAVCSGLGNQLSFWNRKLDVVVLTHPHLNHLGGLVEVLKRYQVGQVLAPDLVVDSPFYKEWIRQIEVQIEAESPN